MADNNDTQSWIDDLERKLQQKLNENILNFIADYEYVSKAFPGNPHSLRPAHYTVDLNALALWAKSKGWIAVFAPEITPPDQQSVPWIRFTKIQ